MSGYPQQQGGYQPQQGYYPQQGYQQQGSYQPQQGGYPEQQGYQQQGGYQQGAFPPQQGMPQQGSFPPQQGAFPPQQGMPQQGSFPPQQGYYPQQGYQQQGGYQQGAFPPQQGMPQQGSFPPQQGAFPPQQGMPQQGYQQGVFPPQQGMPQQGSFPPQQGFPATNAPTGPGEKIISNLFRIKPEFEYVVDVDQKKSIDGPLRYNPNGNNYTMVTMGIEGFALYDHRIPAMKKLLNYTAPNKGVVHGYDMWQENTIIATLTGEHGAKKRTAVIDIATGKSTTRDFYEGHYFYKCRVQQCASPKVLMFSSSYKMQIDDLETGETVQEAPTPVRNAIPNPENPNTFFVSDDAGLSIYDIRTNQNEYAFHHKFPSYDLRLSASTTQLAVSGGSDCVLFDTKTQKIAHKFEVPSIGLKIWRGVCIYSNLLALQYPINSGEGAVMLYDLNALKGTEPNFTENKKIMTSRASYSLASKDYDIQITPEGVYLGWLGLLKASFV